MHRLSRPGTLFVLLCALSIAGLMANTALASGNHHHRSRFKGSGTWSVSPPDTTTGDYTVDGSVLVNSSVTLSLTGSGHVSSCKTHKTKTCCLTTITGQFDDGSGNTIAFVMAGRRCQLSDTQDTIKGPMKLLGSGGIFSNGHGSGVLQGQDNPQQSGAGPVQVSGSFH